MKRPETYIKILMQTLSDGERSGAFVSEICNALELIVENVHVHLSKLKDQLQDNQF